MTAYQASATATDNATGLCYHRLSLIELAGRIAHSEDRDALKELHDFRPVFRFDGGRRMRLADFVEALCSQPKALELVGRNHVLLASAYDHTIDRFANLPKTTPVGRATRGPGSDCRYYYHSFLHQVSERLRRQPASNAIEREAVAAEVLQGMVERHFRLSCFQARRMGNPARSRYAWQVGNGVIRLWMPITIQGHRRRQWLQANVEDPDPSRPGEKARVQTLVDEHLGVARHVPLASESGWSPRQQTRSTPFGALIEQEIGVHGLAQVIAEEKAGSIHKLRPAIRALGRRKVKALIRCIFEDMSNGHYEERNLAESFGLSAPTFSRFAGSRWHKTPGAKPPDLWANVAEMLTTHPAFVEMAEETGLWRRLAYRPDSSGKGPSRRDHDV